MRLDKFLFEEGYVKSRQLAKEHIQKGLVRVDGAVVQKPSFHISGDSTITLTAPVMPYVGRGGLKLEKALNEFSIDLRGEVCLDIGASTGGFTDCMLRHGADFVYAVDSGHGQLADDLLSDTRVQNMPGTNARNLTPQSFEKEISFICVDVSFISLELMIPVIASILPNGGECVLLIKPQFEAGKGNIGKNGVVKSKEVHLSVVEQIVSLCHGESLIVKHLTFSPLTGSSGNIEFLLHTVKASEVEKPLISNESIKNVIIAAHQLLGRN